MLSLCVLVFVCVIAKHGCINPLLPVTFTHAADLDLGRGIRRRIVWVTFVFTSTAPLARLWICTESQYVCERDFSNFVSSHLVPQLSCFLTSDRPLEKHHLLGSQVPITTQKTQKDP